MSLEKMVKAYQNGDEDAFVMLYKKTYALIRYVIYTYVQNPQIIEDLVQDVYTKMNEKIHHYHANNFLNWTYTLAKNIAIDYTRKKHEIIDDEICYQVNEVDNPYLSYVLYHLPTIEREVFLLKVLCGHTTNHIAKSLNLKTGEVNRIYYKAKETLKKSLEER